jgi:hypothetical protein
VLEQLVAAFRQLGQALGIVDQTASDNASVWDGLAGYGRSVGEVFGTLAGAVLPVLTGAVQLVTGAVQVMREVWKTIGPTLTAAYGALKGVFNLIGGLLTGDWKMMWDGFVDIVFGALKAILRLATGALGMLAAMFDSIASKFGFDSGLTQSIESFRAQAEAGLEFMSVKVKGVVEPTAQPAGAHVASLQTQAALGAAGAAGGGAGAPQAVHVSVPVHLDGAKVGEAVATAKRDARARSFEPVPAAAGGGF